jgi:hypothetical protein
MQATSRADEWRRLREWQSRVAPEWSAAINRIRERDRDDSHTLNIDGASEESRPA